MNCPKCGAENINGASFCIKCGSNLKQIQPINGQISQMQKIKRLY